MSIASTMQSMGYQPVTDRPENCAACARSVAQEWPLPPGLRCGDGGFYVTRRSTCRKFLKADHPKGQDGPTHI